MHIFCFASAINFSFQGASLSDTKTLNDNQKWQRPTVLVWAISANLSSVKTK